MAAFKPELFDVEGVLDYYDQVRSPYFAIYAGPKPDVNSLRFEYLNDDAATGRELLEQNLRALEQSRSNTNTYTLQIMAQPPKGGSVTARKKGTAWPATNKHITFQLNRAEGLGSVGGGYAPPTDPAILRILQRMDERQAAIEERLNDMEAKGAQPEDAGGNNNGLGAIGALLENPALAPIIGALSDKLVDWLNRPSAPQQLPPNNTPGIHGIPGYPYANGETQEKVVEIVEDLLENGLTMADLQKLLAIQKKKPMQFKMYIGMLRSLKV